jgi:L-threonylcarbamoyladenylate synthase
MTTLSFPFQKNEEKLIKTSLLENRGTIVYPTETYYALGCAATDASAVSTIYDLKGRDTHQPLLVLVNSWEMLHVYADNIRIATLNLLEKVWPGPLTAVLTTKGNLAGELNRQGSTLGFRMTSSAAACEIIRLIGVPLVGTSANRTAAIETTTCEGAREVFSNEVDLFVNGGSTPGQLSSTVVDFTGDVPRIIREGAVSLKQVLPVKHR